MLRFPLRMAKHHAQPLGSHLGTRPILGQSDSQLFPLVSSAKFETRMPDETLETRGPDYTRAGVMYLLYRQSRQFRQSCTYSTVPPWMGSQD